MYSKQRAKHEVLAALKKAIGKGFVIHIEDLETPPNTDMGDIAYPCFELAKAQGRNPVEIATEIAAKIGASDFIDSASQAGPYVNFYFKHDSFADSVLGEISEKKSSYGQSEFGKGRSVLLEYAQPNTHKEFHVGHVRNAVLGQSIVNLLRAAGYKVIGASYIGDIGAHVAKSLWGYSRFQGEKAVAKEDRVRKLGEIYSRATHHLEKHPDDKEFVDRIQGLLESDDPEWKKLWKETRAWSLDEFKAIFDELNVKPDVWYYESDVEQPGKEMVHRLLTEGAAKKSEGATIIDLEEEGLGAFLVMKSDGSSLYATKDLALALKKEKDYEPDRQVFVVDTRQSFYFKQLFAALRKIGFTKTLLHVDYDMVTLPDGAMSSRKGNIVTYRDLKKQLVDALIDETKERHEDWDEKQIMEVASGIAHAGLLFFMLRQDPKSVITFDIEKALSFEGFTGPYLLYAAARIESVKKKTKLKPAIHAGSIDHSIEQRLIRILADYPEVVEEAAREFKPSVIAQYAFDLAKQFAEYYHELHIIDEDEKELTEARLALAESVRQVLENALGILGIPTLKEM